MPGPASSGTKVVRTVLTSICYFQQGVDESIAAFWQETMDFINARADQIISITDTEERDGDGISFRVVVYHKEML